MGRFFVACPPEFVEEARACFAPEDAVSVSAEHGDLLAFLEGDGPVTVLPCGALPLENGGGCAWRAEAPALREAWASSPDGEVPDARDLKGYAPVRDLAELQSLELRCRDEIVKRHMANGVRFLDPAAVYIDPRVVIGRGTLVLPGTILRGRTVIGRDCEIGPNSMNDFN